MIVDEVIGLLKAGGIRTEAAFPAGRLARITEPVAAVSLEKADINERVAVVRVDILSPQESGGYLCQTKALEACAILERNGAVCSQGGCDFLDKGNLFRVSVKATFRGAARANGLETIPGYKVITGPLTLSYVCAFSAEQALGETDETIFEAPWEFTVEEFFPWGVWPTLEAEEPFQMDVRSMGNIERFEECIWTHRKRIAEDLGIRQIRKGKATGRILTAE